MSLSIRILVVALLVAFPAASFGWSDAGHKIIASMAFQRMAEEQRNHIVEILRHHPRFDEDFLELMPEEIAAADEDTQNEWLFQQAAIWPDIARSFRHEPAERRDELRDRFHRSRWHFINVPHFLADEDADELDGTLSVNLDLDPPDNSDDENMNAIQCIRNSRAIVNDADADAELRALHLCWLFHVIGDIHQPLHSTALFSRHLFPEGDRGGNSVNTRQNGNLHSRWDRFPGGTIQFRTAHNRAIAHRNDPDRNDIGEASEESLDEETWMNESNELAGVHVYDSEVRGFLRGLEESGFPGELPDLDLSDDYQQNGARVSDRRVVEAGYRLAKVLEEVE